MLRFAAGSTGYSSLSRFLRHKHCLLSLALPLETSRTHHVVSSGSCSSQRLNGISNRYSRVCGSTPFRVSIGGNGLHGHSHRLFELSDRGVNCKGLLLLGGSKVRSLSTNQEINRKRSSRQRTANKNTALYAVAIAIAVTGLSYAAVPLYRIFCQASGYGGTVVKAGASEKVEAMEPIRERELTIR